MNNIKEIMGQMRETPSPECWESIASQLPAVGTTIGASATAAKASAQAGKIAATAGKTALSTGKLVAIIASSTAVVATATIITVSQLKPNVTPSQNNTTETSINNHNTCLIDTTTTVEFQKQIEEPAEMQTAKTNDATLASNKTNTTNEIQESYPIKQNKTNINTSTNPQSAPTSFTNNQSSISSSNPSLTTTSSNTHQNNNAQTSRSNQTIVTHKISPERPKTDNQGSENTKSDKLYSDEENFVSAVKIEIPNIFTPNGDGVNDLFVINGIENCGKRTLIVKDKSGQTVFQSNNYENNWDGGNLSDGQYFYFFNYSINNIEELRRGTLYIRR